MARIRSIKPEFFLHEGMAELSPLHRLLFIGLWTLADKAGLLADRPRRIKAALFPWEACDVDALLWDLVERGFIVRYEADGEDCIEIPNFSKHQRPHPKELAADLPGKNTAGSREKKRPAAVFRFSTIPSGTPGKELLESGKELLGAEKPTSPVDSVAAMGATRLQPAAVAEVFEPDLAERMRAVWLELRGAEMQWTTAQENQLRPILLAAEGDTELVLRTWRKAVARKAFPRCTGLLDLAKFWSEYAGREPEERATRGRASEADKDWSRIDPAKEVPF